MDLEDEMRFIRLKEVLFRTSIPKSTLMAMIGDKEFPAPVEIGKRSRAWVYSEVRDWMQNRIDERD